jgi:hypothetical protein
MELEEGTLPEVAAPLRRRSPMMSATTGSKGQRQTGALESLAIVRAQVYRLPASGEFNASYTEAARAVMRTRLAQAGAKLGGC